LRSGGGEIRSRGCHRRIMGVTSRFRQHLRARRNGASSIYLMATWWLGSSCCFRGDASPGSRRDVRIARNQAPLVLSNGENFTDPTSAADLGLLQPLAKSRNIDSADSPGDWRSNCND
jgi:hypothetical protein